MEWLDGPHASPEGLRHGFGRSHAAATGFYQTTSRVLRVGPSLSQFRSSLGYLCCRQGDNRCARIWSSPASPLRWSRCGSRWSRLSP